MRTQKLVWNKGRSKHLLVRVRDKTPTFNSHYPVKCISLGHVLTCPPRRQYKDTSKFLQWTFPFSYANLIPTAQSNSSPVSPESWKTSGIHLDFSPSVGQSHSDASGTETMLCMCHCVAHLCIEMVSNGASRVGFSGNDLPLIWWRYVFVRTELRIVEKKPSQDFDL